MTEMPTWVTIFGGIAAAVGAIGGLAGVATLLKARAENQKLGAEADKTHSEADKVDADAAAQLTGVALKLVEPLRNEVTRLTSRVEVLEHTALVRDRLAFEHSAWDYMVIARGREAGLEFGEVPPLFPPLPPAPASAEVKVEVKATTEPAT